jgi:thiol:disulfide interchange protein DsbA
MNGEPVLLIDEIVYKENSMKTYITLTLTLTLFTLMTLMTSGNVNAQDYKENINYVVAEDASKTPGELKEYFSLFCGACYDIEKVMPTIKKNLPEGMIFTRRHVDFIGHPGKDAQSAMTHGYVAALNSGKGEEFVGYMFSLIHEQNQRPTTVEQVSEAITRFGISKQSLEAPDVLKERSLVHAEQVDFLQKGILKGTPTLMVNNKYVIIMKSLDRKDPLADLAKLIAYLNEQE